MLIPSLSWYENVAGKKATAADGREASDSITMDILPQPELELN